MNEIAVRQQGGDLQHYKPEEGLKKIAVAEAAEQHFKRARDASKLYEAVEAKLGEQRRFVLWWDQQEKHPAGRPQINPSQTGSGFLKAEDFGLDRTTISRWRKRLKDPKKFDAALEAAQARCVKVCEARQGQSDHAKATNTGENEWYTPPEHLEAARDVLGAFDLDPASSDKAQATVKAERYFTKQDDGLAQDWHGRVWLNPPYAQPYIAEFVSKLVSEVRAGRVSEAILLTHNYTDTGWFHEAANACAAICFTRGRVKFVDAKGNTAAPTQGQAFFYFGHRAEVFFERFAALGFVVEPFTGVVDD